VFAGYAFDVQALDIDLNSNTVFFSRNDAEVRIGQASSGTTYTETLSTGQAQVIPASSNVQVAVPAGLVAPGSPIVVEVDTTPETWLSDANYTAGSVSVNLALDPNALMTSDYIDVEIPIGNLPLQDVSANSPGVLNGSVYVFVAPGVGVAVPTQVVTTYTLTGGIRRAVGRIARTVLNLAVLAARAVVQTVTDPVGVLVHVITIAVRVLNCLINGAPPQMALYKWDRNTSDWGPFALPSTPHRRACIVVHGIQLFANSTSAGPSSIRQLGQEMSSAVMPYSQVSLYDAVYGIGYQDSAGIAAIGDSVRALLAGVSANEIDFVCHSLGGLVVRWANEISASPAWSTPTQRISRIVTLGTPHEGVPAGVLQTAFGNSFPLAPIQHCYGQHLTDGAAGSEALTRLRNSQPSNVSTRIYAYAGTRWDDYQSGAGRFIHNLYMGTESDGFVPRYSGLSGSLYAKGDVRARDTVYLNHSTLITDIPFLQGTVLPRLMEDRPGSVPVADFTATPPFGAAPLSVQFTDTSSAGATAWQWDFDNDGVVDSTQRNPSHVYTTQGTYTVRLDVTYPVGVVSKVASNCIISGVFAPIGSLNMAYIPSGTFQMGSPELVTPGLMWPYYNTAASQPVHQVTISRPFWMGRYEVTQAEFMAAMGFNPSAFQGPAYPGSAQYPVESVSRSEALAYCAYVQQAEIAAGRVPLGYVYRLPTEAEWEYCCRAGTSTEFNVGPALVCGQSRFRVSYHSGVVNAGVDCGVTQPAGVGSYPVNAFGLADMHGNVQEWCLDSGRRVFTATPIVDPYTPSGSEYCCRGGGWSSTSPVCRSASRGLVNSPDNRATHRGFRLVLAPSLAP
jgi:formylglycine-generating enzyme required for sulfatase activity